MIHTDGKRTIAHHPGARLQSQRVGVPKTKASRDPVAGVIASAEKVVAEEFARLRGKR